MRRELFEDVLKSSRYVKAREELVKQMAGSNWPAINEDLAKSFAGPY